MLWGDIFRALLLFEAFSFFQHLKLINFLTPFHWRSSICPCAVCVSVLRHECTGVSDAADFFCTLVWDI